MNSAECPEFPCLSNSSDLWKYKSTIRKALESAGVSRRIHPEPLGLFFLHFANKQNCTRVFLAQILWFRVCMTKEESNEIMTDFNYYNLGLDDKGDDEFFQPCAGVEGKLDHERRIYHVTLGEVGHTARIFRAMQLYYGDNLGLCLEELDDIPGVVALRWNMSSGEQGKVVNDSDLEDLTIEREAVVNDFVSDKRSTGNPWS